MIICILLYFIKLSNQKKFLMPQGFSKLPCKMSAKDNGNVSRPLGAEASTAKDSVATAEEKMEKAQAQAPGHEVTMGWIRCYSIFYIHCI